MEKQVSDPEQRGAFLQAMSRVASTVCIVATAGPAGRSGATVSSLVSVSADTTGPTVLVCLHRDGATAQAVLENRVFSVSALGSDQQGIADVFAGRTGAEGSERFDAHDWTTGMSGAPHLVKALVGLDCRVVQVGTVGLHRVVFGAVERITIGQSGQPLVYVDRGYAVTRTLGLDTTEAAA